MTQSCQRPFVDSRHYDRQYFGPVALPTFTPKDPPLVTGSVAIGQRLAASPAIPNLCSNFP
jgi:hypothetical protein